MGKTAIFHIEGGVGKNIVATSVIRCYKKQNPDVDVVVASAYPDIFQLNKNISRAYPIGNTPYFYQDYILNKDIEIFAHDPYKTTSHITKKRNIVESWCNMVGVEYDGKGPDLYLNFREREAARNLLPAGKPIMLFQPFGGPINQHIPYSWMRDIHPAIAQRIANHYAEKYNVVHICYPHHPVLNNVTRYDAQQNKKTLASFLEVSNKRILIDSSLQHMAAALNLPSTVFWVGTQPEIFGYELHENITPKITHPEGNIQSYLFDYSFNGVIHECPYSSLEEIFDITPVLQ
jgi:ADP-heptose:LPS heptosyltransferase